MQHLMLLAPAVVGIFLVVSAADDAAPDVAPGPRQVDVAALVQQLGSPRFDEREAATQRLGRLPVDAPPPQLLEALTAANPEVRRRAADAVRAIRAQAEERALGRERTFANRGKIDRFVASAAVWDVRANDDRVWQAVLDVAIKASRMARKSWSPLNNRPTITPDQFWHIAQDELFVYSKTKYEVPSKHESGKVIIAWPAGIRAPEVIVPETCNYSLIIAWGPVRTKVYISGSVILANGDVTTATGQCSSSVIICDGDVVIADRILRSMVIAHGDIRCDASAIGSVLIARGKVEIKKPDPRSEKGESANRIEENTRHPLGFISFFELSDVGVEVESAEGGVRVSKLTADSPMALARVQDGDVITKVGDHAVKSAEELRRRLRDASAVKGEAVLTLRRGASTLQRRVTIPD
jgi:hypothetical protein